MVSLGLRPQPMPAGVPVMLQQLVVSYWFLMECGCNESPKVESLDLHGSAGWKGGALRAEADQGRHIKDEVARFHPKVSKVLIHEAHVEAIALHKPQTSCGVAVS